MSQCKSAYVAAKNDGHHDLLKIKEVTFWSLIPRLSTTYHCSLSTNASMKNKVKDVHELSDM